MTELAIVIPILALLCFGALSLTGSLAELQIANALSRELANHAFRECLADPSAIGSRKFDPVVCIEDVVNGAVGSPRRFSTRTVPGAGFVVSLYDWNGGAPRLTASSATAGYTSKFGTGSFGGAEPIGMALAASLESYQTLVIAEVYVPATVERIFSGAYRFNQQDTVYASTVM